MDGKLASVSCELESMTCSTETDAGAARVTLVKSRGKGWVRIWKRLTRELGDFIDGMELMTRVCHITPMACNIPR
jgi:hypothetical protein